MNISSSATVLFPRLWRTDEPYGCWESNGSCFVTTDFNFYLVYLLLHPECESVQEEHSLICGGRESVIKIEQSSPTKEHHRVELLRSMKVQDRKIMQLQSALKGTAGSFYGGVIIAEDET